MNERTRPFRWAQELLGLGASRDRTFAGSIEFADLPPHYGLIVSLAFFRVADPAAPVPYDGDPPGDAVTDCMELYNQVDLDVEIQEPARTIPFSIERPAGHYYLQVRTLLFRMNGARVVAQAEQFFFGRRPLTLLEDMLSVTLPVAWPSTAIEDMEYYGTFEPGRPPSMKQ